MIVPVRANRHTKRAMPGKILLNGQIIPSQGALPELGGLRIYEVMRVMDGVCLFMEDHLARLVNSARLAGERLPATDQQFAMLIKELIAANDAKEGNIRLEIGFSGQTQYHAAYIAHSYPTREQYAQGVQVKSLKMERPNPNAKIWHNDLKKEAEKIVSQAGVYEAVLVDNDGFITEGSRSNIFFVRDEKVVTAPFNKVLPGITRKYILQACIRLRLDIDERCLHYKELPGIQAAFLSGTSPRALPVSAVDSYAVSVDNDIMRNIMECYGQMINEYIAKNK